MTTAGYRTPFFGSVSVTATVAGQDIFTLLSAVCTSLQKKACYLAIQNDTTNGSASLYVGDQNVSSTNCGVNLSANQAQQVFAFDSNLLDLDQIFLRSSTGTIQVNLTVVTR